MIRRKKENNWFNNPWLINIGTAVFSLILTMLYDLLKSKPILSSIRSIIIGAYSLLISFINFEIKVWWILVFVIALFLIILFLTSGNNKHIENISPKFLAYKEDVLKQWRWTWNWKLNLENNRWAIIDLTAYCPKCNTTLMYREGFLSSDTYYECPKCDLIIDNNTVEDRSKIEALILDNINKNS